MVNVHLTSMPVVKQGPSGQELQPGHLPTQPIQQASLSTVTIPNPTTSVSLHTAVIPKPVDSIVPTNSHPMVLTATNGAHLQMPQQQPTSVRMTVMQAASCASTMATTSTSTARQGASIQLVKQPSPRGLRNLRNKLL